MMVISVWKPETGWRTVNVMPQTSRGILQDLAHDWYLLAARLTC